MKKNSENNWVVSTGVARLPGEGMRLCVTFSVDERACDQFLVRRDETYRPARSGKYVNEPNGLAVVYAQ
jgi:hypothetical protein